MHSYKAAAVRPAKGKREVGVDIQNCHARPQNLEKIGLTLDNFGNGQKDPHYSSIKKATNR